MHRALTALLVAGLSLFATAAESVAQSVERSMYVTVVDDSSRPVEGLGADAFVVREDGTPREVLRASPATAPIEMAILVDNSQAADAFIADMRRALTSFVKDMGAKGHQVAIIGLADRPTVLVDYTSSAERLTAGANRIFSQQGSGTLLLDSLIDVSRALRKRDAERRVMVVITTEGTDFSNAGFEQTLETVESSGAQLYAFIITAGTGGAGLTNEEARNRGIVLDRGPRVTGGKREHVLTSMALPQALERLAAELAAQYHIVYASPGTTVPAEKVEVDVRKPGLTARGVLVRTRARATQPAQ